MKKHPLRQKNVGITFYWLKVFFGPIRICGKLPKLLAPHPAPSTPIIPVPRVKRLDLSRKLQKTKELHFLPVPFAFSQKDESCKEDKTDKRGLRGHRLLPRGQWRGDGRQGPPGAGGRRLRKSELLMRWSRGDSHRLWPWRPLTQDTKTGRNREGDAGYHGAYKNQV